MVMNMLIIIATLIVFIVAFGLNVSAALDLRRYMPAAFLDNNQYWYILHRLAFDASVPRKLQQRYLLSLFLAALSLGGVVTLALMQPNYPMAILFGSIFLVFVVESVSCWKRYMGAGRIAR
jgi:low temperature requirement protein LtrA